ncbi:MAG: glycosyltransferase [Acidobacteriaceae bacterium]|nr:glycosyltransferase [Acidobacteriaceae bacterium]
MSAPRPKVMHIVLALNVGGLERLLANLSGCQAMRDFDQLVCCLDELGTLAPEIERNGAKVFIERRGPGFDFQLVFRLARLLRGEHVAAVHTHALDPMLYGALAARLAGVPVRVHTQHSAFLDSCSRADRWKFQLASRSFTHLIAVSEQTRQGMLRSGASRKRTHTILNGIQPRRNMRDITTRKSARLVIGSVGRLSPEKGIDRLIRAFAALHSRYPAAALHIVGDGPERSSLEALARELCVAASVKFLGRSSDVFSALQMMDIFVLPSLTEGIPLALLEGMSARLPVIATAVGGVPEVVVDGVSGMLIPPNDVPALTNALGRLMADSAVRESLAKNAVARVEQQFSLAAMANKYRSIYQESDARCRSLAA